MRINNTDRYENAMNKGTNISQSDFVLSSVKKMSLKMIHTEKTYTDKCNQHFWRPY